MSIETSLDMSLGKSDTFAGCIASHPGALSGLTTSIRIRYTLFPELFSTAGAQKVAPLKMSELILLSVNTTTTGGVIRKLSPKETEVSLKIPLVPMPGENVGIARNINSHWRLIGYGEMV